VKGRRALKNGQMAAKAVFLAVQRVDRFNVGLGAFGYKTLLNVLLLRYKR